MSSYSQTIARNLNYEITINKRLNCAFLVVKGYWTNDLQLDEYLTDIEEAVQRLSDKFLFLVDLTNFSGCTTENIKLNIEAQKILVKGGLWATAEVIPDNPILRSVAESMSQESQMNTMYFKDRSSAERWLELTGSSL